MPDRRTINLSIDAVAQTKIAEITGHDKLFAALGYLSLWNMSFEHVHIHGGVYDDNPEIIATYTNPTTKTDNIYVIGAVWHGDPDGGHFGFHS